MEPTSGFVLAGLLVAAIALLVTVALTGRVLIKVVAGVLTLALSLFSGAIIVNDFFGYYTSWGAAEADLTGRGNDYAVQAATIALRKDPLRSGRLLRVRLPGTASGIDRDALVYLPPQYDQPAYRAERFPVVELLHGTPGDPSVWVSELHVTQFVSGLIAHRAMGPVVLVMPDSNGGLRGAQECLDTSTVKDDTYISSDVPSDIRSRFRVSAQPAQWGLLGFSSGGYCAANLMMRHRAQFGSAAMIDGYYRPTGGPAAARLDNDPARDRANDPLRTALSLPPGSQPLPACWIAAGTGNRSDYRAGLAFLRAIRRLESVPFFIEPGAHHTAAADRGALPAALIWSWQQLASPSQRVAFPTVGSSATSVGQAAPTPTVVAQRAKAPRAPRSAHTVSVDR